LEEENERRRMKMKKERYFKVLDENGKSYRSDNNITWSLPTNNNDGTWTPGEWMPDVKGELVLGVNGYHVVTQSQLVQWLGLRIFEVEVGPEVICDKNKSVARTCRLLREYTNWNEKVARLFACDCAERVLHIFEWAFPGEDAPRRAIEIARRYVNGKPTHEELYELYTVQKEIEYIEIHIPNEIPHAFAGYTDAVWAAARAAEGTVIYMEWGDKMCDLITATASYAIRAIKIAGGNYLASAEADWQARHLLKMLEG